MNRIRVRAKRRAVRWLPFSDAMYRDHTINGGAPAHHAAFLWPGIENVLGKPLPYALEQSIATAGANLRARRFEFVGESVTYPVRVPWQDQNLTRLGRLNLNYFDTAPHWILDVARNGQRETLIQWHDVVRDWIANNPIGCMEAWNPYTVSRRLPNWILAHQFSVASGCAEEVFSIELLRSIHHQASYLYSNVEWDLPQNHLAANARALLIAGLFFEGNAAKQWRERGMRLLVERLMRDVCADGGHAERSMMYHALVLQDYLECITLCGQCAYTFPAEALEVVRKMANFTRIAQHPDGEIAHFNDSAPGVALPAHETVTIANSVLGTMAESGRPVESLLGLLIGSAIPPDGNATDTPAAFYQFKQSGYYIFGCPTDSNRVVFDCGEVGIREVAGHSHSDLLSYELSASGERVIVDTGTSVYTSGPRRQHERSIFAHNTLSVDGRDTCEPWADYRMARRGHPGNVSVIERAYFTIIDSGHQSFLGLPRISHRRALIHFGQSLLVYDRVLGDGTHHLDSRLHFHPSINVARRNAPGVFDVTGAQASLQLHCFGALAANLPPSEDRLEGWYAKEFGKLSPMPVIQMTSETTLNAHLGHLIAPARATVRCALDDEQWNVRINENGKVYEFALTIGGITVTQPESLTLTWI